MTTTTNTSGVTSLSAILNDIDLGPTDSVQFMFAKLQLAQSQICKNSAEQYMKQIEDIQKEQSEVASYISKARELQNKCKNKQGDAKGDTSACIMPDDMVAFFNKHNLSIEGNGKDNRHNADEWTYNIESLTNYQESISNKTQTLMVYLQDFISQYNSYLQGASSAINNATQVLTSIARGQ